ncbi:hypothetical protein ACIGFL_15465 [Pseudomonas sp. NPDC077649]|uniref:phosphoribosyltransferase-like protein n=1 Tax=Pseudomonas sp. NPDC077649 TaxID=3364423 RepID=UPI0037CB3980
MSVLSGENGIIFFENVITSTKTLISSGLWKEVNLRTLQDWIEHFETDQEKVLCGLLLDSLIFRSRAQTQALLSNVIEKSIPQLIQSSHPEVASSLHKTLTAKYPGKEREKIIIVPVIRDIDPPTKSGPLVARLYKKDIGVNEKFMEWPWKLQTKAEQANIVIFIDDFVGTGDQFLEFFKLFFPNQTTHKDIEYIYAPLGACKTGLDKIKEEIPRIKICQAETILPENKFFSGLPMRYKGLDEEFVQSMKVTYEEFLKKVGLGKLKDKFGYGELELTYAYAHGTPNATLPILWAANEQYQPIFSR